MTLGYGWVDGPIGVNGGTLALLGTLEGSSGFNTITVAGDATLAGVGPVGAAATVTVQAGGIVSPGWTGLGNTLTLGPGTSLTLQDGSILNYTLGTGVPGGDSLLSLGGDLTIGQAITWNITPEGSFGTDTYPLATIAGTLTDSSSGFNGWTATGLGRLSYTFSLVSNGGGETLDLNVSVPTFVWAASRKRELVRHQQLVAHCRSDPCRGLG